MSISYILHLVHNIKKTEKISALKIEIIEYYSNFKSFWFIFSVNYVLDKIYHYYYGKISFKNLNFKLIFVHYIILLTQYVLAYDIINK